MKGPSTSSEALNVCKTQGYFHEAYFQSLHANARQSKNTAEKAPSFVRH